MGCCPWKIVFNFVSWQKCSFKLHFWGWPFYHSSNLFWSRIQTCPDFTNMIHQLHDWHWVRHHSLVDSWDLIFDLFHNIVRPFNCGDNRGKNIFLMEALSVDSFVFFTLMLIWRKISMYISVSLFPIISTFTPLLIRVSPTIH